MPPPPPALATTPFSVPVGSAALNGSPPLLVGKFVDVEIQGLFNALGRVDQLRLGTPADGDRGTVGGQRRSTGVADPRAPTCHQHSISHYAICHDCSLMNRTRLLGLCG